MKIGSVKRLIVTTCIVSVLSTSIAPQSTAMAESVGSEDTIVIEADDESEITTENDTEVESEVTAEGDVTTEDDTEVEDEITVEEYITTEDDVEIESEVTIKGDVITEEDIAIKGVNTDDVVTKTTKDWDGKALSDEKQTKWKVVWKDEFDGDSVDGTKWGYQIGDGREYGLTGWGNNEKEYYTDGDNVEVNDGKLTITAKKDNSYGNGSEYTSAKLWTKTNDGTPLFTKKYGRIEAKMSLPEGTGYWPAFWMMPVDDVYGGWAASGEIDIMEARGRITNSIDGTAHYGSTAPNKKAKGGQFDTRIDEDFDFTEEHEYAIEWLPGQLKWYVDDICYYTLTNWYSIGTDNVENFTYPAPFDQEFYIMLNLAVGGNYDSGNLDTSLDNGKMVVDYVRVYDLLDEEEKVYDYAADEDTVESASSSATGGLEGGILNETNFIGSDLTQVTKVDSEIQGREGWYLQCQSDASANASVNEGGTKISISSAGANGYSVQLMHQFPLTQGYEYELSFEAKSDANRNITAQFGDFPYLFLGSWDKYSDVFDISLTPEWKTYTYRFDMKEPTDDYARIELNMGASSTDSVYIRNASLKAIGIYEGLSETDEKTPTKNGEHIYNGTFDQGNNKDAEDKYTRLRFWNTFGGASAKVTNGERKLVLSSGTDADAGIEQTNVQFLKNDAYKLTYDTDITGVVARVVGNDGTEYARQEAVSTGKQEIEFTVPENAAASYGKLQFIVGNTGKTAKIDNVSVTRETNYNVDYSDVKVYPLENGTFTNGLAPWTIFTQGTDATVNVSDNICKVKAVKSGESWHKMLVSNVLDMKEGMKYKIHFETKADKANEKFTAKIENASYTTVFNQELETTTEWEEHDFTFTASTGGNMELKFLLAQVTQDCEISFRNVQLSVLNAPIKQAPYIYTDGIKRVGENAVYHLVFADEAIKAAYGASDKVVTVNGEKTDVSFNMEENTLVIPADVFDEERSYKIKIVASGFDFSEFTTQMYPAGKNVLLNGSFSRGLDSWGSWFNPGEGAPAGSISATNSGEVKMQYVWANDFWDGQISQDNIPMEQGQWYEIQFDARATLDRPIMVSISGESSYVKVGSNYQTYTCYYMAKGETGKLEFFTGNVKMGSLLTPVEAHTIYLDNIKVNKMDQADIDKMIPTVTVKQSYKLTEDVELELKNVKEAWRKAAKTVYLNGEAVAADKVSFSDGMITIDGTAFIQTGVYEVVVKADGFADTNMVLQTITSVGIQEYMENGDFSKGDAGWTFWAGGEPPCAKVTYADNEAKVNMIYPWKNQFGVYDTWGIQLSQTGILVDTNQEYILRFQAKSEVAKKLKISVAGGEKEFDMTSTYQKFEYRFTPTTDSIDVGLFLGACDENTKVHNMAIKEVSLQKTADEAIDGMVVYRVEHYVKKDNGYVLKEKTEGAALVNANVTAVPKNYTGYTYSSGVNGTISSGNVGNTNGALTLKLYYKPNTYKIMYQLNQEGAVNAGNATKYTYGTAVSLSAPTCEGYQFAGWYLDKACTMQTDGVAANMTGDITLYAAWIKKGDIDNPVNPGEGGSDKPVNPGEGGSDKPINPGEGGSDNPVNPGEGGSDNPVNPGEEGSDNSVNPGEGASDNSSNGTISDDKNPDTENVNSKYVVKLNAKSVPLQFKKSTTAIKATVMKGDKVAKWSSSNKKVATVNQKGKITAGKKVGTAKITVTTVKGAKATVTVKVQKAPVKTKKVTVTNVKKNKLVLKKGAKFTLKTVLTPITSPEKVKYTTSDKKVVSVSSKGQIKAKKKGKAKITVMSGSKKVTITVTVK